MGFEKMLVLLNQLHSQATATHGASTTP